MMVVHDFYTVIARQYELEKEMGVERGAAPSSKKSGFFDKFKNQK